MSGSRIRPLRVVQLSFKMDELRREPDELLDAWPTVRTLADAAAGAGVHVTVLQAAWRDAELVCGGIRYAFVAERAPSALRRRAGSWAAPDRRVLIGRAARYEPDVVHVHGMAFPLHARSARRRLRVPVLVQHRGDPVPPRWRRPLARHGYAGVDAAAFTSREQASPWFDAGVFPPGFAVHQVLGSSSRFTPGDRDAARSATGVHGDPAILWVGRLAADKDPFTAIDAVAAAARSLPGLQLWCCFTDSPLLEPVRRRIAAYPSLSGRVHLLGRVPPASVEAFCRAADLFLAASRRESTGFALLEALACGLPPVVTDIPAFRRIVGTVGSFAPPGDAAALARAIVARTGRRADGQRRAVRDHFERRLSLNAMGAELRSAYEALARRRAQRAPP